MQCRVGKCRLPAGVTPDELLPELRARYGVTPVCLWQYTAGDRTCQGVYINARANPILQLCYLLLATCYFLRESYSRPVTSASSAMRTGTPLAAWRK